MNVRRRGKLAVSIEKSINRVSGPSGSAFSGRREFRRSDRERKIEEIDFPKRSLNRSVSPCVSLGSDSAHAIPKAARFVKVRLAAVSVCQPDRCESN